MTKHWITRAFATVAIVTAAVLVATPAQAAINSADGFDVSWAQCGQSLPAPGAFSIIDVDGGRPFASNSCLTSQISWAKNGNSRIELYANTANPGGPTLTRHVQNSSSTSQYNFQNWPSNPTAYDASTNPRACTENPATTTVFEADTVDCAYDYGYQGAKDSYRRAAAAFSAAGLSYTPAAVNWWLDLEVAYAWDVYANTWRGFDPEFTHPNDGNLSRAQLDARNQASLQGAHDYLVNVAKVRQLGLYGSPNDWNRILHGNLTVFKDHPVWYPIGSSTRSTALDSCATAINVTGAGKPVMVQFIDSGTGLDMSVRCNPTSRVGYTGNTRVLREARMTIALHLTATNSGAPLHGQPVRFRLNGVTYRGVTNANGDVALRVIAPRVRGTYTVDSFYDGNSFGKSSTRAYLTVR